jgi:hypothetical protein
VPLATFPVLVRVALSSDAGQPTYRKLPSLPLRASARIWRVVVPSPCSWSSTVKRPAKVRTNASMGPVTSRPSPADQSASVAMARMSLAQRPYDRPTPPIGRGERNHEPER